MHGARSQWRWLLAGAALVGAAALLFAAPAPAAVV
jgi:hypothetical protein